MYAILSTIDGALFVPADTARTFAAAASLADDAVYGAHHARALVLDMGDPVVIVYDTDKDGPYRNCPRCSGMGRYQTDADADTECEGCAGTGHTDTPEEWIACDRCHGTRRDGPYPCAPCAGTGVVEDIAFRF